jgi:hypothetical protein
MEEKVAKEIRETAKVISLYPILDAIERGLRNRCKRRQMDHYEVQGLIIAEITRLKGQEKVLKNRIRQLKEKNDILAQIDWIEMSKVFSKKRD